MQIDHGFLRLLRGLLLVTVAMVAIGLVASTLRSPGAMQASESKSDTSTEESMSIPAEHFVIMRHALAPGTGDPPEFTLEDCSTQRNLSAEGREQARQIGQRLRAGGISEARVYTSQWCRCRDTAELLGLGKAQELPALNSFFQNWSQREPRTQALREWLAAQDLSAEAPPLILVSHQVNISALTGTSTASGEVLLVKRGDGGEFEVIKSF
jgi:phosphohistidine phosphatase SixA